MAEWVPVPALAAALGCTCPRCGRGRLYSGFLRVAERCGVCGLELARNDSGDGPAVFLIFVLGALLVPSALILEFQAEPPVWVHVLLWPAVTLAITLPALRPLKAYVIALQYRNRRGDWERPSPQPPPESPA